MDQITQFLFEDEKILWKKGEITNYTKEAMKYILRSFAIMLLFGIVEIYFIVLLILDFNIFPILMLIIWSPFMIFVCIPKFHKILFLKKQGKLLPKEDRKHYEYASVITNKRFIYKHITNFNRDETAKYPLIFSDYVKDIFSVNLDNIKMVGTEYEYVSHCNLYLFSEVNFEFPLTPIIILTLDELISVMKMLNDLIQFEQEEHYINGGIVYFSIKQDIPKKYSHLFRYEENKIKQLQDVIKINKNN